ncbi:protein aspartic protease in guard cell 2 [Quercus suber]|uniref:Protein aspartic protease in guard cell 2 n=1 Tax=Quercus suber TaxID=58331 RepID=A0AAW0LUS4_QUESU
MAIQVLFLLLACVIITTTTTTNFTSSHTSTSTIAFNAKIGLVETQTNLADERKSWKLEVVHRDKIHPSSFQQHMKHDAKRVANLIHQLDEDGVYYPKVEHFKEDVGLDLGSGEYFIPVGLGTPPTPQYLVIDTGSDIGWLGYSEKQHKLLKISKPLRVYALSRRCPPTQLDMAIRVLFLLLACITITTTTTTNFTSTIAFNAKIGLVETQTNPANERKSWKLEVVHRDRIHPSNFQQRIKRNAKRVANLIHQLDEDGVYYPEVECFKEDVGSDSGSGEYFIPIELDTPPTPQYLVIDTGSDIG